MSFYIKGMKRLRKLLESADEKFMLGKFPMRGNIPVHYKRLSVKPEEADRLAMIGAMEIFSAFNIQLYYTQSVIAGAMLSGDYDTVVVVSPSQYGKLIADDEPVMTADGWKRHGNLKVGDRVVAPNGEYVKVIYVHPKMEADREVVFQDGSRIKCHHNHEWVVFDRNCKKVRTVETHAMEERGLFENSGHGRFAVRPRKPMAGEKKDLAVAPYVFGAWLGDGSTTKGQICAHPDDIAVLDKCREYYPEGAEWVHKTTGVVTRSFIGLANDLSTYDLCFQRKDTRRKYIPDEYLTASLEQRLELLAGLIDTDGYQYEPDGRFYFTTADETLKDTFEELMTMDDKEIKFWKEHPEWEIPFLKECGMDWDAIVKDYDERMEREKMLGIDIVKNKFFDIISTMSYEDFEKFEDGELPSSLSSIIEVDPVTGKFISKKYKDIVIGTINDVLDAKEVLIAMSELEENEIEE